MRRRMYTLGLTGICLALLWLVGCGVHSPARTMVVKFGDVQAARPTYPDLVGILRTEPSRPHEGLGEVYIESYEDLPGPRLEQEVREGAAKLGAGAAVIVADRSLKMGGIAPAAWWAKEALPDPRFVVAAVAIRYLQ